MGRNLDLIGYSIDDFTDYLIFVDAERNKYYLPWARYARLPEIGQVISCKKPFDNCLEYVLMDSYLDESEWSIKYYPESDKLRINGNIYVSNIEYDSFLDIEENLHEECNEYFVEDVINKIKPYNKKLIGRLELFDFIDEQCENLDKDEYIQNDIVADQNYYEYRSLEDEDLIKNVSFKDMINIVERSFLINNFNYDMDKRIDEYYEETDYDRLMLMIDPNHKTTFKENSYLKSNRSKLSWVDSNLLGYNDKLFSINFVDRKTANIVSRLHEKYVEYSIKGALVSLLAKYLARKDAEEILIFGYDSNTKYIHLIIAFILYHFNNIKRITVNGWGAIWVPNYSDFFKRNYHKDISYKYPNNKEDDNAFFTFEKVNKIKFDCTHNIEKAIKSADIIINVTPGRYSETIKKDWIKPGATILIVGDDYEDYSVRKPILEEDVFIESKLFIDDLSTIYMSKRHRRNINKPPEIKKLLDENKIKESDIYDISHLFSGKVKGRQTNDEVTLFYGSLNSKQKLNISKMLLDMSKEKGFGDVQYFKISN